MPLVEVYRRGGSSWAKKGRAPPHLYLPAPAKPGPAGRTSNFRGKERPRSRHGVPDATRSPGSRSRQNDEGLAIRAPGRNQIARRTVTSGLRPAAANRVRAAHPSASLVRPIRSPTSTGPDADRCGARHGWASSPVGARRWGTARSPSPGAAPIPRSSACSGDPRTHSRNRSRASSEKENGTTGVKLEVDEPKTRLPGPTSEE